MPRRTLPDPIVAVELPEEPARPEGGVQTRPVAQCVDADGQETPGGVLFADETAAYTGHLRVSYDELRGLYSIDQRTWAREREVYRRYLDLADDEVDRANGRAERNWWERHGAAAGLTIGVVVGAAITIGIAAALDGTTDAI